MRHAYLLASLAAIALASLTLADSPPTEALPSIFNGRDLTGWQMPNEPSYWSIVDGAIVGQSDDRKQGSMLFTEKSYGDAIVEAEVRFTGEIDSGIMMRKPELQVQIGVSRSLKSLQSLMKPQAPHGAARITRRVRVAARASP